MESTSPQFMIIFLVATAGMLIMAIAIVYFLTFYQKKMLQNKLRERNLEVEHQQKMLTNSLESQENERRRVAAELHDGLGAMLSAVRVTLHSASKNPGKAEQIEHIKMMIDDTIESVRRISRDLMPAALEKFGLVHALIDMCDQYSQGENVEVTCDMVGEELSLEKTKELIAYRIVQEFVNNSLKHSRATVISIEVRSGKSIEVSMTDNGRGFVMSESNDTSRGIGLYTMQNRARMLNGEFQMKSAPGEGTSALLTIPLH